MCYSATSGTLIALKYAKHRGDDPAIIKELERQLEELLKSKEPKYFANGYDHPELLVFTNEHYYTPDLFEWGLIPSSTKDIISANKIRNQTLNARCETIWEKFYFRNSAQNKRCLIYVDGFFEYHHFKGKAYPYYISLKSGEPITFAGLWDEWINEQTAEFKRTCTIITTNANTLLQKIHNNPKVPEPRMPAILTKELQDEWIKPNNKRELQQLLIPFDANEMIAYPVRPLKGKNSLGNSPEVIKPFHYENYNPDFE
jgi:putative SOS response-associated peptidase YedK